MTLKSSLEQKRQKFAFNTGVLKERFLNVADTIFYSNISYQKQYDLLMFRMHNPNLPLPNILFSYSLHSNKFYDQDRETRDFIETFYKLEDSEDRANFSISQVLQESFKFDVPASDLKLSPQFHLYIPKDSDHFETKTDKHFLKASELKNPFVIDYFCTSTFPSIFAHFMSNEYLLAGFNFIRRHINDKLAPRLVGTYLFHTPLFKDRFLTTFIKTVITPLLTPSDDNSTSDIPGDSEEFPNNLEDDMERIFKDKKYFSADHLLKILYEAFSRSISYLTEYHFKAVNLLREEDEQSAILSITLYFLSEIISVWKYSPLCNLTSIFNKTNTIKNPDNFNEIFRHNILDDLIADINSNDAFAIKILDLFRDQTCQFTEIPDISSMKYDGGFRLCVSIADMYVIHSIAMAEKKDQFLSSSKSSDGKQHRSKSVGSNKKFDIPQFTNVRDFISAMFLLRFGYKQYLSNSVAEPKSTIISKELCEEKLNENEVFLKFLIDRMEGMKLLQMCSDSSLNVLRLKERQYATLLIKNKVYSNHFKNSQLASFCFTILAGHISFDADHYKKFKDIGKNFYDILLSAMDSPNLNKPLLEFLIDQISKCYQMFRANIDGNNGNRDHTFNFYPDLMEPSQFLISEIDRMSFELLLAEMNETPFKFIKNDTLLHSGAKYNEFRKNELDKYLKNNTIELDPTIPEQVSDFALYMKDGSVIMNAIISLADDEMKNEIDKWVIEKFRIGDKLLLFLQIKDFIKKSLEKSDSFDTNDPQLLRYYLPAIIRNGTYDYDYFRANLINCIKVFKKYICSKGYSFPTLGQNILEDLHYLSLVFDIKF